MGVVYGAVQLSLGRRVALKVLPFAATLEKKHLQRFENEARAAALLHHTNIVPVYAVGCERGVHFYAMQLIEGHTLAAVIQQIRDQESGVRGQESGAGRALSEGHDIAGIVEAREETVSQLSLALTTQRTRHDHEYFRAAAASARGGAALGRSATVPATPRPPDPSQGRGLRGTGGRWARGPRRWVGLQGFPCERSKEKRREEKRREVAGGTGLRGARRWKGAVPRRGGKRRGNPAEKQIDRGRGRSYTQGIIQRSPCHI
jgi:hypothetical protein